MTRIAGILFDLLTDLQGVNGTEILISTYPPVNTPKPSIPSDAPDETVWFGGPIEWFSITLRIIGDELVPDEITRLLQVLPDQSEEKGKPIYRDDGSLMRIARCGGWRLILKHDDTDEWDCGEAMRNLLRRLPADLKMWESLAERYRVDFFVGLTMTAQNRGFELSSGVMGYLAERRIKVGFDIYYEPAALPITHSNE